MGQAEPSSRVWQGTVHVEGVCVHVCKCHSSGISLPSGCLTNIKQEAKLIYQMVLASDG